MKPSDIFEIMDLAKRARENGHKFNPLFVGPPGIGKSEIVQAWCKKEGIPFIDLRVAYMEPPDMIGFPQPEVVNGRQVTVHYTPEKWPDHRTEPRGVLLIEEPNRGSTAMMNTLMQLLTDRCIDKYKLPEGWIIAGNVNPEGPTDDVNSMGSAFRDRWTIFNIEYDKKTFVKFMKEDNWDETLRLFIESGTWVYRNPEDIGNVQGAMYLSPRSLSKVNAVLKSEIPAKLEYELYTSLMGDLTGKAFYSFKHNESPVTFFDLKSDLEKGLQQLKRYSNPEDYKSGHIAITVRSLLENEKDVDNDLLISVSLVIPADQSVSLISEIEFKRKLDSGKLLRELVDKEPKVKQYLKEVLKKQKD